MFFIIVFISLLDLQFTDDWKYLNNSLNMIVLCHWTRTQNSTIFYCYFCSRTTKFGSILKLIKIALSLIKYINLVSWFQHIWIISSSFLFCAKIILWRAFLKWFIISIKLKNFDEEILLHYLLSILIIFF